MTVYFYGSKEPYWEFSNFSRYDITLDNEWWRTSEHYFQAQKFVKTDAAWAEKIRGIEKNLFQKKYSQKPLQAAFNLAKK